MKKRLFLIIAVLFCVLFLIATAAACADKGDTGENLSGDTGENPGGDVAENPESGIYYTVTFDTRGGSEMDSVKVKVGAIIGGVALPTKQCSNFVSFAKDADGEELWNLFRDTVTGNITLYTIWEDAHTLGEWETLTEPTCTTEGRHKRICEVCGKEETEDIPALGHTWGECETVAEPTCTADGRNKRICEVCEKEETENIPALGHDFEEKYTVDVAPDCDTKGSESRHCTRCNAATDSREIEAFGHTWSEWETLTEPTCTTEGTHKHICGVCGKEETESIPALGHDWSAWETLTEPTCTTEGTHKHICGVCGKEETESMPVTEHDWSAWETLTEPTCTTEGTHKHICGVCGKEETESIPVTEHDWSAWETLTEPTCTTEGTQKHICGVCGKEETESIPMLKHDFTKWGYDDEQHWKICSRCGVISEKTAHDYNELYKCECGSTEITPESEFTFTALGDGTYSLADYSGVRKNIRIPATYDGGTVVNIESTAFSDCKGIISVIVPDSVKSIGLGAFSGCSSLESITIPFVGAEADKTSSDTYQYPFGYIFGTTSYTGGMKVTQAYYGSSASSTTYATYYIPSSLRNVTVTGENILYGAFYGCSMLTSVAIGNSIESIGNRAFYGCAGLSSVVIGNSIESIGEEVFSGCTRPISVHYNGDIAGWCGIDGLGNMMKRGITLYIDGQKLEGELVIPDSVTEIKSYAFYNCTGLTSVTIGNSVAVIGDYAFAYCTGLPSVTIGNSVTSIGECAFAYCTGLNSVTVGRSVASIGNYAFSDCTGLTSIYYTGDIAGWCAIDNLGEITKSGITFYIVGQTLEGELIIPDSVTEIKAYAFYGCTELTSVRVGNSVASIGESAFEGCTGLTSVYYTVDIAGWCGIDGLINIVGSDVTLYIGGQMLEGELIIPDSVTEIKSYAFYNCAELTSVTIGNSVTSIGNYAFYNCNGLTSVNYSGDIASWLGISFGNSSANPLCYAGNLYVNDQLLSDLVIPDPMINAIKDYAFYNCTGLIYVTIPDSVTSIGNYAFNGCSGLRSAIIDNKVTSIGEYAFRGCTGLTAMTLEGAVTSVGSSAFKDCTGLISVTIGNSVTNIGSSAFENCTGLISVTIGNSVIYVGNSAFRNCVGLTSVTISDSVANIGKFAFGDCTGLISVTLGYGLKSIESHAFRSCYKLVEVHNKSSLNIVAGSSENGYVGHYAKNVYTEEDGSRYITTADGYRFIYDGTKGYLVDYFGEATDITLPDSFTAYDGTAVTAYEINQYAFFMNASLTAVTIPDSVTGIGVNAFEKCTELTSVTIGCAVASIGDNAFNGCYKLMEVYNKSSLDITAGSFENGGVGYYAKNVYTEEDGSWFTDTADGYRFLYDGAKGYLVGYYGNATDIILPDSFIAYDGTIVNGYEINQYAFYKNADLASIVIPDSVTGIRSYAFCGCTGLTSVTVPKSVTSIGEEVFSGCSSIESITIPFVGAEAGKTASDTYQYPFGYIFGTASYAGGTKVYQSYYGDSASSATYEYYYIPSILRSVTVTGGNIPRGAFYGCTMLTSVTMGNSVTSIGEYAFSWCTSLTSVIISDSVTGIGSYAFSGCTGLTSVTIPDAVTSIGGSAFRDCTGLSAVTIPDAVTSIKSFTFSWCTGLTSVTIGNLVMSIGEYAFSGCMSLTSLTIPDSVTSIGSYAFAGCTDLMQNENDVYYVDKWAIDCDTSITELTLRSDTAGIGDDAFHACNRLTAVTIPDSVKSIGNDAFSGCKALVSVTIGNSVERIGDHAFYICMGLTSVYYDGDIAGWCGISFGDQYANPLGYADELYIGDQLIAEVLVIPDSVTEIKSYVFSGYTGFTSVDIGNSVESIESYAFRNCTKLTSMTIPETVKNIGVGAFSGCSSLESITIPFVGAEAGKTSSDTYQYPFGYIFGTDFYTGGTGVEQYYYGDSTSSLVLTTYYIPSSLRRVTVTGGNILYGAFYGCAMLTSVTIRNSVTDIGESAFYNCTGLTAVPLPDSVKSIGNYAFYGCTGFTSVTIPDSVESIGDYAFYGCTGLTFVAISDSVESIGDYVFYGCTGLTSVTIGNSVTSIGDYAFSGCTNLTSVVFEDTEGWQVSQNSSFGNYTSPSSANLADASTAATYLTSTYRSYYWRKAEAES